jgi:hypothetical protein
MKLLLDKSKAKRRGLGFIPLNDPFLGSEGHHIDKLHVIYIPEHLHSSIYHNIWNGHNMDKINTLAFEWLGQKVLIDSSTALAIPKTTELATLN